MIIRMLSNVRPTDAYNRTNERSGIETRKGSNFKIQNYFLKTKNNILCIALITNLFQIAAALIFEIHLLDFRDLLQTILHCRKKRNIHHVNVMSFNQFHPLLCFINVLNSPSFNIFWCITFTRDFIEYFTIIAS